MKTYLGIDYGMAHVGLASASTIFAEPLETVPVGQAFTKIQDLIATHQIDTVVLGLSSGVMNEPTREFASRLESELGVQVVYQDETLSSHQAETYLLDKKRSKRRGPDHHYAAAVILQEYLDSL